MLCYYYLYIFDYISILQNKYNEMSGYFSDLAGNFPRPHLRVQGIHNY